MLTLNDLRDRHGIDVYWTQNMIGPGVLRPTKHGRQWFFSEDEALVALAMWQSRGALGTLPRESYVAVAEAIRALFEKDTRREGILYATQESASWEPLAPALTARLGG